MDRSMKTWELALVMGLLVALVAGAWLGTQQQELADRVIRLHVIANSDTQEDQSLKLAVRDEVLAVVEKLYPPEATAQQAQTILEESLSAIAAAGRAVVEAQGYSYPVEATLTRCWFPTKEYEDFALPAGQYQALRVVVGSGAGENWWCVAFPPLCVGAASQTVEEAAQAGLFTGDQASLITGDSDGYVLKFRALELLGQLQGR